MCSTITIWKRLFACLVYLALTGCVCATSPCWVRPQRWLKSLPIGSERQSHSEKKKENYFGRPRIPKEYLWVENWLWEELPKKWNKGRKQVCYWLCITHLPTKALLRILLNVIFWKVVNYSVPWLQTHVTVLLLSIVGKRMLVLFECG